MPICSIVSASGIASYTTAKFITKILQNYCSKTSSFIKDGTEFIQKIEHISIPPEEETLVSFDVSALFTRIPVPVVLQVINSKISICTNFTNFCKIPIEKFIKLLEFTISNYLFCSNKKFNKQLQGETTGSPVSMSLQTSTWNTLNPKPFLHLQHKSNGGSGMLMMSTVPPVKTKSTNFKSTSIP